MLLDFGLPASPLAAIRLPNSHVAMPLPALDPLAKSTRDESESGQEGGSGSPGGGGGADDGDAPETLCVSDEGVYADELAMLPAEDWPPLAAVILLVCGCWAPAFFFCVGTGDSLGRWLSSPGRLASAGGSCDRPAWVRS